MLSKTGSKISYFIKPDKIRATYFAPPHTTAHTYNHRAGCLTTSGTTINLKSNTMKNTTQI